MNGLNQKTNDISSSILNARDARYEKITDHFKTSESLVVILKSNTPGKQKQTILSKLHLKIIHQVILQVHTPQSNEYHESFDGNYYLYTFNEPSQPLKKKMMYLENTHPIGRFVDIDVYTKEGPISRRDLKAPSRKCFLCHHDAHYCSRSKKHSLKRLNQYIENTTLDYLIQTLTNEVTRALHKELYLHPKFGLVTAKSNGAHTDMTKDHFEASIEALTPYFKAFLTAGTKLDQSKDRLRAIGLEAEVAMFEATQGVNTHKGIIFLFGIILPFYLEGLLNGNTLNETITQIKSFALALTKHDFDNIVNKPFMSHGEHIYLTYGIKGIRGEISEGFPSLFSWYKKYPYNDYQKLCAIMARLDDTTIIKRKNLGTLRQVKLEMQALLEERPWRQDYYETLSKQYLNNNISPGGAADLLSVCFFFEATDYLFNP